MNAEVVSNKHSQKQCQGNDYDIVIAGGGMVGASLALLLSHYSQQQLKMLVVESFPIVATQKALDVSVTSPQYSPSFDARSTALSFGSRTILESLGFWPMLAQHLAEISDIHVSERGRFGSTTMNCNDVAWPALGYVVENTWLGNVLLTKLRQQSNVDFAAPASVLAIKPLQIGVAVTIEQQGEQRTLQSQLAVVADGANSELRKKLGIDTQVRDYRQRALITNVSFSKAHNGIAYERFTEQGPLALLPLTDSEQGETRAALVWSLPKERAQHLCDCDAAEFLQALQHSFGHRQGEFIRVGERSNYDLSLVEAQEQVRSGIVVMGNAAHSLHPVAGQGFNLALRDCVRLSQLLAAAFAVQQPLHEVSLLQRYQQQQQFDQQKTIGFSNRLPDLFSHRQWPLSIFRNIGLSLLDVTPVAKNEFILHAAGLHPGASTG
ncbi:MAG: 2-polyprenyl-6-methoxyphenol 4-hydroxylase [Oceanicoccus sp.]